MKTNKFTPGPWKILPYQYVLNEPTRARIHGPNNEPVIDDANPTLANARLIAAAPEMLDLLRELTASVNLSKLNVRKDFDLLNVHACAMKLLHKLDGDA
jgi:hypothetical protein